MKKLQSIGLFLLLTLSVAANAANRYVPTSQYPTIQAAINACSNGDTVIVADGTYTGPGNRDIDFLGKAITVRSENGLENCVIDCESLGRGFYFHTGEDEDSVLEGFTITKGQGGIYCDSSSPMVTNCTFIGNSAYYGGGMGNHHGSSPTVTNCTFAGNSAAKYGGGMSDSSDSNATLTNCIFIGNSAKYGGGMYNTYGSSPTLTNCTFAGNSADNYGGGMSDSNDSNATLTNCIFIGNSAGYSGGGMYNRYSSPTVTNCTFSGNSADYSGGGMHNRNSSPTITNCILWGDSAPTGPEIFNDNSTPTVTYSDIAGAGVYIGTGNINDDPLFVDADGPDNIVGTEDDNLRFLPDSLCIDAGDNSAVPADTADLDNDGDTVEPTPFDLDGNQRIVDGDSDGIAIVDMGAFELCSPVDLVVRASDISFVPDSPVEPGTIIVVSAEVHNFGTEDANSFVVRFFNGDPDSGGIQIGGDRQITSLAGGASEVVSVAFTTSPEPQSYEIFILADAAFQIEEANETNNKAFRILTAGPDLGLTSSDISFSAQVAGEVRITAEVHNVGRGNVDGKIGVSFYNGDPETGGTYIGDANIIGGIAEGLSEIADIEWSNPALGTYNIYVVVDPEGEIIEISKANNKAFNILSATLDLTLISEDISFNPEAAIVGQQVEISATTHNNGFLPCEEFVVKFYDGDPNTGGSELGAEIVDRIAGLGSMQVSILFTFTSGGKHEIYVVADANNEVEETNEDNNLASNSLYVQYATIQEAIDAASPGDTVYIGPGTYNENLSIDKSITLIGAGSATTIIDGGGTDDVVLVTADNVTIKGFTVQNSIGDGSGIHLRATGASVSENIITQCYYGIFCDYSSGSYIAHNTVTANSYGIYCEYASGDAIRYNTITNNTLYGAKSYNSTLANCFNYNYFSGNPVGYSYDPEEPVGPLLFGDNVLQDNEIGIEVKETSASDLEFSDNTIVGSDIGISCENANPLIRDNALSSNTTAIYLVNSSSPTIEENTISENNTGIVHDESSEPILIDNTMTGNVENVNIIPAAICQDVTVAADDNCQGIVSPEDVDNGSYDSDGDPLSLSLDPSAPYDIGTTSVTLTVSDGMATASCQATVTVLTAPSVTYDGNTLLSTGGNPTVDALLVATLSAAYTEEVTFTLTADGVETIVVTTNSIAGVASAVQALEPAIYKVEVTLKCSEATAIGILVVYNPEGGFATGGGWIVPEADGLNTHPNARANFGFNAKYKQDSPTGHIEFRYSDGHIDLKSSSIEQLVITGGKIVQFKGLASVNREQGHWFFVKAIDNGEPGTNDTFEIKVWAPGVSEEGNPTERAGGILQGGNIVVHTKE